jgi:hypothetical protein
MKHSPRFLGLCLVIAFSSLFANPVFSENTRPNVVIFFADDLGWADVGDHCEEVIETPSIDRIAAEGIQLDRFYSAPICSPTRAALMTGRPATGSPKDLT